MMVFKCFGRCNVQTMLMSTGNACIFEDRPSGKVEGQLPGCVCVCGVVSGRELQESAEDCDPSGSAGRRRPYGRAVTQ